MRQDAVMQQVFILMNKLLQSNKSTSKRKLTIRTYKVWSNITFKHLKFFDGLIFSFNTDKY